LNWIAAGPEHSACRVLAEGDKPIINPYSHNAYAVGGWQDCPETLEGNIELSTYESYVVRDHGIRLYAPWGRTNIFRFYPLMEGWGYGQKFRFDWIPPAES
jgi:hypothetical protein